MREALGLPRVVGEKLEELRSALATLDRLASTVAAATRLAQLVPPELRDEASKAASQLRRSIEAGDYAAALEEAEGLCRKLYAEASKAILGVTGDSDECPGVEAVDALARLATLTPTVRALVASMVERGGAAGLEASARILEQLEKLASEVEEVAASIAAVSGTDSSEVATRIAALLALPPDPEKALLAGREKLEMLRRQVARLSDAAAQASLDERCGSLCDAVRSAYRTIVARLGEAVASASSLVDVVKAVMWCYESLSRLKAASEKLLKTAQSHQLDRVDALLLSRLLVAGTSSIAELVRGVASEVGEPEESIAVRLYRLCAAGYASCTVSLA